MKYLLGIDVGTTGAKAILFDLLGNPVSSGYREYGCKYLPGNAVEQDAGMLRESVFEVCQKAIGQAQIDAGEIGGVSVSAQRCCTLFIDREDKVLKMISWLDNRASEEVAQIESAVGGDRFYQITGMPLGTTWMLPKILWVQKHEPAVWQKTKKIVQLQDYILKCLGVEEYHTDIPEAAFWGFWDTDRFCWSNELLQKFQINQQMLPIPGKSGNQIGKVSEEASGLTGLRAGTALALGIGDQNSAAIGAGVVCAGMASVSIGTGGLATVFLPRPFRDPTGKTMVTNSAVHGSWQMEGLQNGAGGVLRWFRDEIAALEKVQAEQTGGNVYQLINEMVERSGAGANGLVFLPYLASAGTPRYNQFARGTLVGLSFAHTRSDMARAVMEGITMEQKDILTSFENAGIHTECIRIMGGATNSEVWNRMQADIYNKPVETLKIKDAAVLGAAISAAACCGEYGSMQEAAEALVKTEKIYEPDAGNVQVYQQVYDLYCEIYAALSDKHIFEKLSEITKR